MAELVAGAQTLKDQVVSRWINAKVVPIESNASTSRSLMYSISIDLNSDDPLDCDWFANQILAFCRYKKSGSVRIKSIRHRNLVASGTHSMFFWVWRTSDYDIGDQIQVEFSTYGETDPTPFEIPILRGEGAESKTSSPHIDLILDSIYSQSATDSIVKLAIRMRELGFLEESVAPVGKQKYPKNAIRKMQDYMGLERTEYNQELHWQIWNEMSLSFKEI
jgi:hypothetical protein